MNSPEVTVHENTHVVETSVVDAANVFEDVLSPEERLAFEEIAAGAGTVAVSRFQSGF